MTEKRQVRAGVYGRESEGRDRSIQDQLVDGRREAETLGWSVVAEYRDAVSASRHARRARDDWPKIIADIGSGKINAVILRDSSRGDRKAAEWLAFLDLCRDRGALIRSVTEHETYDVTRWRDYAALAAEGLRNMGESERIRGRSLTGHANSYAAGRPTGGPCPFGYRRIRQVNGPDVIVTQEPDPETKPVVVRIFDQVIKGVPLEKICRGLEADKIPPPGGGDRWWSARVRDIVVNPAVIGKRKHNGDAPRKAQWEPLVSENTFTDAGNVLAANRQGFRPGRVQWVLSGIMVCACEAPEHNHPDGVCGCRVGVMTRAGSGTRYGCERHGCAYVQAEPAEEHIIQALFDHILSAATRHRIKEQAQTGNAEYEAARAEADRLTGELDRFTAEAASVGLSAARLAQVERDYTKAIEAAEKRAQAAALPPPVRHFLMGPDTWDPVTGLTEPGDMLDVTDEVVAAERFADMPIPARRELIRSTMWIKLHRGVKGKRQPVQERISFGFR